MSKHANPGLAPPVLVRRVTENNARNLVLQLRRLADQTTGDDRRRLRDLANEQERIVRELGELEAA